MTANVYATVTGQRRIVGNTYRIYNSGGCRYCLQWSKRDAFFAKVFYPANKTLPNGVRSEIVKPNPPIHVFLDFEIFIRAWCQGDWKTAKREKGVLADDHASRA